MNIIVLKKTFGRCISKKARCVDTGATDDVELDARSRRMDAYSEPDCEREYDSAEADEFFSFKVRA